MPENLFSKILHANDGSDQAFEALNIALAIAKQNDSELHIVSVGQIELAPQFIQDIREQKLIAAGRLRRAMQHARASAAEHNLKLHHHLLIGEPVRKIVTLARKLDVKLLVVGAQRHSAIYERVIGSQAAQIVQLAHCPVLVVKTNQQRRRRLRNKMQLPAIWGPFAVATK